MFFITSTIQHHLQPTPLLQQRGVLGSDIAHTVADSIDYPKKENMGEKMNKILVLYATQSGNAFDAAERIGREAERRGCPYAVLSVDDYDPKSLGSEDIVIFVVSTTGQGDAPDSLKSFWRFLLQSSLRNDWLKGVNYAVFGLGDSGYQKYNFVAKKLDNRLSKLGAKAIIERGLGDDQHPSGYEGALDPWLSALWNVVYELSPSLFPNGLKLDYNDISFIDQPKVEVVYHDVVEESYSTTKVELLSFFFSS
ncbi:hypothetical protein Leryth_013706 [Lithospermum erythrorhizon]|nr:hypothetical protein Leryth_013706 [Lithospermum erythrorhizon]